MRHRSPGAGPRRRRQLPQLLTRPANPARGRHQCPCHVQSSGLAVPSKMGSSPSPPPSVFPLAIVSPAKSSAAMALHRPRIAAPRKLPPPRRRDERRMRANMAHDAATADSHETSSGGAAPVAKGPVFPGQARPGADDPGLRLEGDARRGRHGGQQDELRSTGK